MRESLSGLQALRGIACLLVLGYHLQMWEASLGLGLPFFGAFRWFGYAGVDLFFVLSGFVIAHANAGRLGQPTAVPGYLARRLWRIFPLYWCAFMLGLAVIVGVYKHDVSVIPWSNNLPGWLTLVPLARTSPNLFVPQAWTLTYEVMFYVAFALVVAAPRLGRTLFALWGVAVAARLAFGYAPTHPAVDVLLSGYVLEFLAGFLLASIPLRGTRPAFWCAVAWLVLGSVLLNVRDSQVLAGTTGLRVLVFGPIAAATVARVVALERAGRLSAPAWLLRVGDASYSIYLAHLLIGIALMQLTIHWRHNRLPHLGWCLTMLAATLGGGFLMHFLLERPLLALARRTKTPRRRPLGAGWLSARLSRRTFRR